MKYFNLFHAQNFKTGINPCEKMFYNATMLTPTQKLKLASCRIFNTTIGDGFNSGRKALKLKSYDSTKLEDLYKYINVKEFSPYLEHYPEREEWKEMKFERRKQRILMRGVKIGNKKASASTGSLDVFSQKKNVS